MPDERRSLHFYVFLLLLKVSNDGSSDGEAYKCIGPNPLAG